MKLIPIATDIPILQFLNLTLFTNQQYRLNDINFFKILLKKCQHQEFKFSTSGLIYRTPPAFVTLVVGVSTKVFIYF
jgi:hypothetical protein